MAREFFLKKLNLLYVEDDDNIRVQLASVLENFFNKVYTAPNGVLGLEFFKKNQNNIDIILSDINMPKMTGIEMVKAIRELDHKIPVIFATAYSDTEYLFEAIKLQVYDYIIKPIDIKASLTKINDLAGTLYQATLIEQQYKELDKYKEVIDLSNIVIKTDLNKKISYVNDHFCVTTGYEKNELIGEDFSILAQNENDIVQISGMFETVQKNEAWKGKIKSKTKSGVLYIVDCYTIATMNDDGEITGTISIQRDVTQEFEHIRAMKRTLIREKSDAISRGKGTKQELLSTINNMETYTKELEQKLNISYLEREKVYYDLKKLNGENNRLKNELSASMKNTKMTKEQATTTFKMGKYNTDLKTELKKLIDEKEDLSQRLLAIRSHLEPRIEELEKENEKYLEELKLTESIEVLNKKLAYSQQKVKDSFSRIEYLEKEILSLADKKTLDRILTRH